MSNRLKALGAVTVLILLGLTTWLAPSLWAETQRICSDSDRTVVLLHGLARSNRSMAGLRDGLVEAGFNVINVDYPSTAGPVEQAARQVAGQLDQGACEKPAGTWHFVTHSMGGIVLRQMLAEGLLADRPGEIGRAVMISPPNQGSEVVDVLGEWWLFRWWHGPAGGQLGTGEQSLPNRLGPALIPVGVLAGDRSINLLLSRLIPGDDDGKVAVERARLDGMQDFRVLPHSHPLILSSRGTLEQTRAFLEKGRFDPPAEEGPADAH